jgi:hypothetical protein
MRWQIMTAAMLGSVICNAVTTAIAATGNQSINAF